MIEKHLYKVLCYGFLSFCLASNIIKLVHQDCQLQFKSSYLCSRLFVFSNDNVLIFTFTFVFTSPRLHNTKNVKLVKYLKLILEIKTQKITNITSIIDDYANIINNFVTISFIKTAFESNYSHRRQT